MRALAALLAISLPATALAGPWVVDRTVTVSSSEAEEQPAEPAFKPVPEATNVWKPIFAFTVAADVALIAFTYYSNVQMNDEVHKVTESRPDGRSVTDADCGTGIQDPHFTKACSWHTRERIGVYSTLGVTTFAVIGAYFAFRSRPSHSLVAITPTLSREVAGAQMSLTWVIASITS